MALQLITKINCYAWSKVSTNYTLLVRRPQYRKMLYSQHVEVEQPEDDVKIDRGSVQKPDQEFTYRPFEKSSTYQCIKLPFKKSRLASPFPDPVKMIESDVVSDQDKANQMQSLAQLPQYPAGQQRYYSTDCNDDKQHNKTCKKVVNNDDCPKAESPTCKSTFKRKKCKKQEAPIDSFSDVCRSSLKPIKRTECNTCPKKIIPPTAEMKITKKYHTSALLFAKRWEEPEESDIQSIESYIKTHNFPIKLSDYGFPTCSNCSRGITGYSRPFTYSEYRFTKKEEDNYKTNIEAFEKQQKIDEKCKEHKETTKVCPKDLLVKKKKEYKPKSDK
ncbi:hypothetical protein RI129_012536 [Pyrocoelia pectoralis]|uniref:Uncharacterized protein n=1 Tax=Pyrocoelia pectoralis TaxID=417401 RepID=A0AAN7ZF05_9COLE